MFSKFKIFLFYIVAVFTVALLHGCKTDHKVTYDGNSEENFVSEWKYTDYVSTFQSVELDTLKEKIDNNDRFIVYIGRESCQYCQIFVPKLYQAALEMEETIFYFDIEGLTEEIEVINFLNNFDVKYTPTLIKFEESGNYETLDFDSKQLKVADLKDIL
jgi:predicted bacteriocin transport accessory protein